MSLFVSFLLSDNTRLWVSYYAFLSESSAVRISFRSPRNQRFPRCQQVPICLLSTNVSKFLFVSCRQMSASSYLSLVDRQRRSSLQLTPITKVITDCPAHPPKRSSHCCTINVFSAFASAHRSHQTNDLPLTNDLPPIDPLPVSSSAYEKDGGNIMPRMIVIHSDATLGA